MPWEKTSAANSGEKDHRAYNHFRLSSSSNQIDAHFKSCANKSRKREITQNGGKAAQRQPKT
eukprot:4406106-Pleurochrysis_carterae.AAC.8